jgi:hypothetical protein
MKQMNDLKIILITFAILGFISCSDSPPIEEKKLVKIYSDMIFLQDTTQLSQVEIKKSVLKKYKINHSEYDETILFYNQKPERWQKFFDSVIVYIEKKNPKPVNPDLKSLPKRSVTVDRKNL